LAAQKKKRKYFGFVIATMSILGQSPEVDPGWARGEKRGGGTKKSFGIGYDCSNRSKKKMKARAPEKITLDLIEYKAKGNGHNQRTPK